MKKNISYEEFTELLASSAPAPGGGGACALVGAVAASLGNMVGSLTVGKKKYKDVEEDLKLLMKRGEELRLRMLQLIEDDAEAFLPLSKAYGMPAETEEEKLKKRDIMEECLVQAATVPLNIVRALGETMEIICEFAEKGSKLVISDAATAAVLCKGALQGAAVNVYVNTHLMKTKETAEMMERELEQLQRKYKIMADEVYEDVLRRL